MSEISRYIWKSRYRHHRSDDGAERSLQESWSRVATAIAAAEQQDQGYWSEQFLQLLSGFRFLPGGRILAGAGTDLNVTLLNCFVMGVIEDDMQAIFEALKQGALTMQAGGGVGYDFSTLRPAGCKARTSGRTASGPVSFMQVWNTTCATLLATASRRGAMLGSLRCDHPDIEQFVDAKRAEGALPYFNLSVQVSDEFMQALANDESWPLVFPAEALDRHVGGETVIRAWPGFSEPVPCTVLRRLPARALWDRIMEAAYASAEPGVLFIDRINAFNNLSYCEHITTTNPCGELPLPPYGACDLGSINLVRFIDQPFTSRARFDFAALRKVTALASRFLDNIIDCSRYPLPEQASQARGSRRIGLGITGLADALTMLGMHYGGGAARQMAGKIMQCICYSAYRSSIKLAAEKGSFPLFAQQAYLQSNFIATLPQSIRDGIAANGIRNSHLTAIAPCGTISLLANNVSSGIEPVFDYEMQRTLLDRDGSQRHFKLQDYAFRVWKSRRTGADRLPDYFVTGRELSPRAQLQMQATLQRFVDSSISKTVTVGQDCRYREFRDLYYSAYEYGLKGCTVFRPGPVRGEVLSHAGTLNDCGPGCDNS